MTARDITIVLWWKYRSSSELLVPRYTPLGWWECDLWRLTKSGFVDEFEIKLSRADFQADLRKEEGRRIRYNPETRVWDDLPARNKHLLLSGAADGPNRFWFVVPEVIEGQIEVPSYAGLLVVRGKHCSYLDITKQAPRRHARKWEGDRLRIMLAFYYRFWTYECGFKPGAPIEALPFGGEDIV